MRGHGDRPTDSASVILAAPAVAAAKVVVDAKENHAFEVPEDWEDQHDQFGLWVRAEAGGSLGESKYRLQANNVEDASEKLDRVFANANTTFKKIGTSELVSGKNWTGRITTFRGTVNTILQMVAKDDKKYRTFHLTVPNAAFAADKEKYLEILRSWRSPAR